MEVSIQNQKGLDAVLSVKINKDDYHNEVKKSITDYQKKMRIPGFRPGKVPYGVVQKMVEAEVKREQVDKLLQKNIQNYLKENNINLVLSPLSTYVAEDIDWKKESFEFTYDIGMRPEIKPDFEALNKLTSFNVEAAPESIDKEIENIRKQAGEMKQQETVTDEDELSVVVRFQEINDEGTALEDGQKKIKVLKLSEVPDNFRKFLVGKAKNAKETVNIFELLSEKEVGDIFGVDSHTVKDLNKNFEIEITEIFMIDLAEMNQTFFDSYFEPGKVTTEEEFKGEWKNIIESHFNQQAKNLLFNEVKKALMENTNVELPEAFIKKYLLLSYNVEKAEDLDNYDKKLDSFKEELKWVLISDSIAEAQEIKITDEDILHYAKDLIRYEFSRMGMGGNIDDKTLNQYAQNYLNQESNYARISMMLKDNAVFNYINSIISPVQETIPQAKFEELAKAQQHQHEHEHEHEHSHDHDHSHDH